MTTMTIPASHETRARVVLEPEAPAQGRRVPPPAAARPVATRPAPVVCDGSAEPNLAGSRLTARGRVVVVVLWCLLAAAAAFAFVRPGAEAPTATVTVRIGPGDTLWQVASDVAPGVDPRETVAGIVELNELSSGGDIAPGDVLRVPVGE